MNFVKLGFALLVFLLTFTLFLSRIAPTISGGDAGELAGAGATLGIAHSPGYPLYSLLGRIFTFLFPFGNCAYRMNLMSLFFASLTCVFVYLIVLSLTKRILPAVISAFILSFAGIFCLQGLVSEVFTLNTFFASFLIFLVISYQLSVISKLYLFSFLFALGLGNHHTLLLLLPAFAFLWWKTLSKEQKVKNILHFTPYTLHILFFFFLGFSVYLYLPIRSLQQPLFDWEDPQTIDRFWGLITRARYGTLQLTQGGGIRLNLDLLFKGTYYFFYILNQTFTALGIVFIISGLFFLFRKKDSRVTGIFLVLLFFFSGPFFFILSGVRTLSPGMKYILERFVTLSLVPAVIILGIGIERFLNFISHNRYLSPGYLVAVGLPLFLLIRNYPAVNQRNNYFFSDYGKNILRNASNQAIIFSDRADESEFSLAYLHNAEGRRKDLEFIDCNAGVSRSIYGSDYYRIWGKPRLARREKIEKEMIETTKRTVYYSTLLPEQTAITKYLAGLLYEVKPVKEKISWQEFCFLRKPLRNDIRGENLFLSYYNLLGKYFLAYGSIKETKTMFDGLKTYGEEKDWVLALAYAYYEKGYLDEAEKEYNQALKLNPDWPEALSNLGSIYEQQGKPDKAVESYEQAIRIKPDYPDVYYNLGVLYWKKEEWERVVTNFEKVLVYNPGHQGAKKYLPQARGKLKVKN